MFDSNFGYTNSSYTSVTSFHLSTHPNAFGCNCIQFQPLPTTLTRQFQPVEVPVPPKSSTTSWTKRTDTPNAPTGAANWSPSISNVQHSANWLAIGGDIMRPFLQLESNWRQLSNKPCSRHFHWLTKTPCKKKKKRKKKKKKKKSGTCAMVLPWATSNPWNLTGSA